MKRTIVAVAVVVAGTTALAACGGGSAAASQVTLHGTVSESGVCGRFIPPNMSPTVVIDIVSPSGAELAQVKVSQLTASHDARCSIPFTVTGLRHERLYGVKVEGGNGGTVYVHPGQAVTVQGTL